MERLEDIAKNEAGKVIASIKNIKPAVDNGKLRMENGRLRREDGE